MLVLSKVISGGQCGADEAGLVSASSAGFLTGGIAPLGFKTRYGPNLDLRDVYHLKEDASDMYQVRTAKNVQLAGMTIRLAYNFNSAGEKCTLAAISKYNRLYLDVDLKFIDDIEYCDEKTSSIIQMLNDFDITVLNVAGNADKESRFGPTFQNCCTFLYPLFSQIKQLQNDLSSSTV